jgi:Salmonella virulence plasmid 65kDa B protein
VFLVACFCFSKFNTFFNLNIRKNMQSHGLKLRKWLVLYCLFSSLGYLCAQTTPVTATYNTAETGQLERFASKSVTFNAPYSYNSSAATFLKAYIKDGNPQSVTYAAALNSESDITNKTIKLSLPVGAIGGAHSVSLTGSASYGIPINIAPGTQGMVPSLTVGYNSHAGNGLLGMGWNLGGLSVISRAGKDIYHDGEVSPVENTDEKDFYTLDGNRLMLTGGTYGASGSI